MSYRSRWEIGLCVLATAGFTIPLIAARPPPIAPSRPAAGQLLISTHQVEGLFFARSLVLLLEHSPEGAAGLILNHPSMLVVATLVPELADAELGGERVHVGGPVSLSTLLLLFRARAEEAPPAARRVLANLYVGGGDDTLKFVRSLDTPTDQARMYLGYAGWGAGQLETEIARGDWIVVPGKSEFVFHAHPETLWSELIAKHGGVWAAAAPRPRSPSELPPAVSRVAPMLAGEAR